MLKAVLYYPIIKRVLDFSQQAFNSIYDQFPQINFIYTDSQSQFEQEIIDADYILAASISQEIYLKARQLKALFIFTAGREDIPGNVINNIRCYFGHFHGQLMAESLLGAMLFFNQHFPYILELQQNKLWQRNEFQQRHVLAGQSVALVGYGTIGKCCAKLLNSFAVKVYAVQRTFNQGQCDISNAKYIHINDLDSILPMLDHVVSFLPFAQDTRNLFNADFFAKLSPRCCFYNLGRGHAVNEEDLIQALDNKTIAGAMLDVFQLEPLPSTSKLWHTKNLLITPHVTAFYHNYTALYLNELPNQINEELKHQAMIMY